VSNHLTLPHEMVLSSQRGMIDGETVCLSQPDTMPFSCISAAQRNVVLIHGVRCVSICYLSTGFIRGWCGRYVSGVLA
jgi:hypothetical protein